MENKIILTAGLFFSLVIQPAHAYIDPGSGSAIMTVIIGFFVAIGVHFKTLWYKIKAFFGGSDSKLDSEVAGVDEAVEKE